MAPPIQLIAPEPLACSDSTNADPWFLPNPQTDIVMEGTYDVADARQTYQRVVDICAGYQGDHPSMKRTERYLQLVEDAGRYDISFDETEYEDILALDPRPTSRPEARSCLLQLPAGHFESFWK